MLLLRIWSFSSTTVPHVDFYEALMMIQYYEAAVRYVELTSLG